MKKMLVALLFGLVVISGSAFADVDCTTQIACNLDRGDGNCHPALLFLQDDEVDTSGVFIICDGSDCLKGQCSDPIPWGPFPGQVGVNGVFFTFMSEPPVGTLLSGNGQSNRCTTGSACANITCGTYTCPIGAADLNLVEVVIGK